MTSTVGGRGEWLNQKLDNDSWNLSECDIGKGVKIRKVCGRHKWMIPDVASSVTLQIFKPDELHIRVTPPRPAALEMLPVAPVEGLALLGQVGVVSEGNVSHLGSDHLVHLVVAH